MPFCHGVQIKTALRMFVLFYSFFLWVCNTSLLKAKREKEKLFTMSNFYFCLIVFYHFGWLFAIFIKLKIVVCKLLQFGVVYDFLFGKGLTLQGLIHYHTTPRIYEPGTLDFVGKGKKLWYFVLFPQCFLMFQSFDLLFANACPVVSSQYCIKCCTT